MFLAVFPPDKYTSVKSTGLLEFTCSHHVYCITAAHKVYMHRKNVLKPQRSRYVNKSRPALVAAHGLASHTFSQPQSSLPPPPLHVEPSFLVSPLQPSTSYCCRHAHIIRPGICLPSQLSRGVRPSLLYRVLWVQTGQVDNGSFLFLWQATAQPLRPCFMGSPFRLTSSFGTQHWLRLTHLYTSR